MKVPDISVVVPVYGCVDCLDELSRRVLGLSQSMGLEFELILVNDGSPDASWERISALCAADPRVKGLQLSRNFGQHQAIAAGLDAAKGGLLVVMDCDLQDDPAEIPALYAKLGEGHDAVVARRALRQDGFFKRLSSWAFHRLLSHLTGTAYDPGVANFGIYRRPLIEAVRSMGDTFRVFPLLVRWVGFKVAALDVKHGKRHSGETSYSLGRLLRLALTGVLAFSDKPLRNIVGLGFLASGGGFAYAAWILFRKLAWGIDVPGWASVIVSLWLLAGLQMIVIGIVGLYVGRTFEAGLKRPIYILRETKNL